MLVSMSGARLREGVLEPGPRIERSLCWSVGMQSPLCGYSCDEQREEQRVVTDNNPVLVQ